MQRVFGLVGICPVVRMEDQGFEQLKKDVVAYMDEMYPDKNLTFKVEARRAKKSYPKTSMEINCDLGCLLYTSSGSSWQRGRICRGEGSL